MTRECHVRFCERLRVKPPWPTHHRSGFCIWYKRLEKGVFHFPVPEKESGRVEIEAAELAIILEGIDLAGARRRPRFVPAVGA